jgi:hypothetical protein
MPSNSSTLRQPGVANEIYLESRRRRKQKRRHVTPGQLELLDWLQDQQLRDFVATLENTESLVEPMEVGRVEPNAGPKPTNEAPGAETAAIAANEPSTQLRVIRGFDITEANTVSEEANIAVPGEAYSRELTSSPGVSAQAKRSRRKLRERRHFSESERQRSREYFRDEALARREALERRRLLSELTPEQREQLREIKHKQLQEEMEKLLELVQAPCTPVRKRMGPD